MYLAVQAVLNSREGTSAPSVPAFAEATAEFSQLIGNIQNLALAQVSRPGAAADKAQTLHVLGDATYEIAAATRAYAAATGNTELATHVNFSRWEITHGRDPEIVTRIQDIAAAATDYVDSLRKYGVTTAKLNDLKKKIETYQAVQPRPREARAKTSAATHQLSTFVRRADGLLRQRLDTLAVQFKEAQPSFYNAYRTARRIVDNPAGHTSKTPQTSAATETATVSPPTIALKKAA